MGLRSREWFFGECYRHAGRNPTYSVKNSPLYALADKALRLGFKQQMTGGHILQTCGATQKFLQKYPKHKATIRKGPQNAPYRLNGKILTDWLAFFASKKNQTTYGRKTFQYDWSSLRTYLTSKYGGNHNGGGGGNDKLELVLRLMAEFV